MGERRLRHMLHCPIRLHLENKFIDKITQNFKTVTPEH